MRIDKIFSNNKNISNYNLLYLDEEEINQVEVISGAFMFLRANLIEKVGYFDELFFLYGEDIDYCNRINKIGGKIMYYPSVKIIHHKGKSAESNPFNVIYHFHNSMIKYYNKYENDYRFWKVFKIIIVFSIIVKKYLAYFNLLIKNVFKIK